MKHDVPPPLVFALFAALLVCQEVNVLAEEKDVFVPEIVEAETKPFPFSSSVMGRWASFSKASPRFIINKLEPNRPIVGATLLPEDKYFSIKFSNEPPSNEHLLEKLGGPLGLRIQIRPWEGEFLAVQLPASGIPAFWEPSSEEILSGIMPVEPIPALKKVVSQTPGMVLRELSHRTDSPLLDLTGLRRRYNFIFEDSPDDLEAAVRALGLHMKRRTLQFACIVVEREQAGAAIFTEGRRIFEQRP